MEMTLEEECHGVKPVRKHYLNKTLSTSAQLYLIKLLSWEQ